MGPPSTGNARIHEAVGRLTRMPVLSFGDFAGVSHLLIRHGFRRWLDRGSPDRIPATETGHVDPPFQEAALIRSFPEWVPPTDPVA